DRSARCGPIASGGSASCSRPRRRRADVKTLMPDELGAHMSIAGGLHLAIERGQALGCFAVQIFVKNQRQWAAPPLRDDDVRAFRAARRSSRVQSVFAHASYLINLASPDPAAWQRAVSFFTDELERAEALGLACVAIHPGSHLGTGTEASLD